MAVKVAVGSGGCGTTLRDASASATTSANGQADRLRSTASFGSPTMLDPGMSWSDVDEIRQALEGAVLSSRAWSIRTRRGAPSTTASTASSSPTTAAASSTARSASLDALPGGGRGRRRPHSGADRRRRPPRRRRGQGALPRRQRLPDRPPAALGPRGRRRGRRRPCARHLPPRDRPRDRASAASAASPTSDRTSSRRAALALSYDGRGVARAAASSDATSSLRRCTRAAARASSDLIGKHDRLLNGQAMPSAAASREQRAVERVDLRPAPALDVLQHRRPVVALPGMVEHEVARIVDSGRRTPFAPITASTSSRMCSSSVRAGAVRAISPGAEGRSAR